MSETPDNLYYATTHEWVRVEDDMAIVGISDFAQGELGDVVFVELPQVGTLVSVGDEICVVESVKTASDLYAPVSGEVVAVNEALNDAPEAINSAPYSDGWLFRIRMSDKNELAGLLNAEQYQERL